MFIHYENSWIAFSRNYSTALQTPAMGQNG